MFGSGLCALLEKLVKSHAQLMSWKKGLDWKSVAWIRVILGLLGAESFKTVPTVVSVLVLYTLRLLQTP